MLVKNQIVPVTINKKNIDWYQSKNYECELKDNINVKVEDLIPNSRISIKYQCDECGLTKEINYCDFTKRHQGKDKTYCFICANKIKTKTNNYYMASNGFKICNKCERQLPANTDYFFNKHDTKDGFTSSCKECKGHEFTDKLTKVPQDGFKFCIKCNRELPIDIKYFPPDKMCKDGLRNVCRECGKDGHFMEEGYIPDRIWSEEENKLFINRYPHYTSKELIELFYPNETMKNLSDRAYRLNCGWKTEETKQRANEHKGIICSQKLKGIKRTSEQRKRQSERVKKLYEDGILVSHWIGRIVSDEERKRTSERNKGKWAGNKNPRHTFPLKGKLNGRARWN